VDRPVVIDAYGAGSPPTVSGADVLTYWRIVNASAGGTARVYSSTVATVPRAVWENDIPLSHRPSLQDMVAPGTWHYDSATRLLFVRTSDDTAPERKTIEVGTRPNSILLRDQHYVTLDGLQAEKSNDVWKGAIWIDGTANGSTGVTVRNCTVRYGMSGIMVFSANNVTIDGNTVRGDKSTDLAGVVSSQDRGRPITGLRVTNNTFHDLRFGTNQPLDTTLNTVDAYFSDNTIYNTSNYGMQFNRSIGTVIERNVVHDGGAETSDTFAIHVADAPRSIIRHNRTHGWRDPSLGAAGAFRSTTTVTTHSCITTSLTTTTGQP
jgi:parallel beta-helix repeat protein